jgi:hypothetical protein
MFIRDGYVWDSVEYHTSHSWFKDEKIREANSNDQAYLDLMREIRQKFK